MYHILPSFQGGAGDDNGDYDGGNYYGIVLNWNELKKYQEVKMDVIKDLVVAETGDGSLVCVQ